MANSQNGWPVNPPRRSRLVAGTPDVRVTVADGPAGDVLMHVLAQFHARVEPLTLDSTRGELDDWGYAPRPIRGGTETSNHASGTAVDGNATRHPLGVRGTFSPDQVEEIHKILDEVDNVVRWGGDYSGRVDEMHFEINASYDRVAAVAARLEDDMPTVADILNTKVNRQGSKLGGTTSLGAVIANFDRAAELAAARDAAILAAVAALAKNPAITPAALAAEVDKAVDAHMPTAEEVAAAQREFLEDLIRDVVPDELADDVVTKLGEKLAAGRS